MNEARLEFADWDESRVEPRLLLRGTMMMSAELSGLDPLLSALVPEQLIEREFHSFINNKHMQFPKCLHEY